ncbi:MAG: NADH-quinone oxidoreductase subunit L [Burkholderiaceae bacterium]
MPSDAFDPTTLLPWSVALVYLLAAVSTRFVQPEAVPRQALRAASLAVIAAGLALPAALEWRRPPVTPVVLLLVSVIAWAIVRYSQRHLAGEAGLATYHRSLLQALAAISIVVVTQHLLALALAWIALGLPLHRLLAFYAGRPQALRVAHAKRVFDRAGDVLLLASVGLLRAGAGSFDIGQLLRVAGDATLPATTTAGVVLLALAVTIRSAQLPFHGWLIQVMEAPTPVSALLHAGVVNLGGVVLLRLAPLVDAVPAARITLLVFGLPTAALAALVASTRISIKVALAWSTCAQMGFMLLEAGLGWWPALLLHLIGHSLYKAHAFLAAGGAVRRAVTASLLRPSPASGGLRQAGLIALGFAVVAAFGSAMSPTVGANGAWLWWWMAAAAAAPLLSAGGNVPRRVLRLTMILASLAAGHHVVASGLLPARTPPEPHGLVLGAAAAWLPLAAMQVALWWRGPGPAFGALHRRFYGGLFVDAWMSRHVMAHLQGSARAQPRAAAPALVLREV